jgi:hypothetical protein
MMATDEPKRRPIVSLVLASLALGAELFFYLGAVRPCLGVLDRPDAHYIEQSRRRHERMVEEEKAAGDVLTPAELEFRSPTADDIDFFRHMDRKTLMMNRGVIPLVVGALLALIALIVGLRNLKSGKLAIAVVALAVLAFIVAGIGWASDPMGVKYGFWGFVRRIGIG